MLEQMKTTIEQAVPDAIVYAVGDDGQHFEALVISQAFEGLPLVRQHQMVMKALKEHFDSEALHALALKTFTPQKWDQEKSKYPVGE